jgi:hypothetical protein
MANLLGYIGNIGKTLFNLPGDILGSLGSAIFPTTEQTSFDAYCKAKGGTVELRNGKKVCVMNQSIEVGEGHYMDMMGQLEKGALAGPADNLQPPVMDTLKQYGL